MKKRFHIALVKKNRKKVPSISVETHSQSISNETSQNNFIWISYHDDGIQLQI